MKKVIRRTAVCAAVACLVTASLLTQAAGAFPPGRYAVYVEQVAPTSVVKGTQFNYEVVVHAVGPAYEAVPGTVQPRVVLVDKLPDGITFNSATIDYGDVCSDVLVPCQDDPLQQTGLCTPPVSGVLSCDLGPIGGGYLKSGVTVTISVNAPGTVPAGGTIVNTAVATGVGNTGLVTDPQLVELAIDPPGLPTPICGTDIDCISDNVSVATTTVTNS